MYSIIRESHHMNSVDITVAATRETKEECLDLMWGMYDGMREKYGLANGYDPDIRKRDDLFRHRDLVIYIPTGFADRECLQIVSDEDMTDRIKAHMANNAWFGRAGRMSYTDDRIPMGDGGSARCPVSMLELRTAKKVPTRMTDTDPDADAGERLDMLGSGEIFEPVSVVIRLVPDTGMHPGLSAEPTAVPDRIDSWRNGKLTVSYCRLTMNGVSVSAVSRTEDNVCPGMDSNLLRMLYLTVLYEECPVYMTQRNRPY